LSRRAVDAVFQALFLLTDLRAILRETAPSHTLNADRKEQAAEILKKLKKQISVIERELVP
jgi:hypothetical protein